MHSDDRSVWISAMGRKITARRRILSWAGDILYVRLQKFSRCRRTVYLPTTRSLIVANVKRISLGNFGMWKLPIPPNYTKSPSSLFLPNFRYHPYYNNAKMTSGTSTRHIYSSGRLLRQQTWHTENLHLVSTVNPLRPRLSLLTPTTPTPPLHHQINLSLL